jgi:hypothetical protein
MILMDSEDEKSLPRIESWSVVKGKIRHTLEVSIYEVDFEEITPSPYAGGGTRVTLEEFLQGKFHDDMRRIFGERVLDEALAIARHNISLKRALRTNGSTTAFLDYASVGIHPIRRRGTRYLRHLLNRRIANVE